MMTVDKQMNNDWQLNEQLNFFLGLVKMFGFEPHRLTPIPQIVLNKNQSYNTQREHSYCFCIMFLLFICYRILMSFC